MALKVNIVKNIFLIYLFKNIKFIKFHYQLTNIRYCQQLIIIYQQKHQLLQIINNNNIQILLLTNCALNFSPHLSTIIIFNPYNLMKKGFTYESVTNLFKEFLTNFEDPNMFESENPAYAIYGRKKYLHTMQRLANDEIKHIDVLIEDLDAYFGNLSEKEMLAQVRTNTSRYVDIFNQLVHEMMPARNMPVPPNEIIKKKFENILNNHRKDNIDATHEEGLITSEKEKLPIEILKNFTLAIVYGPRATYDILSIRELKASKIGSLIATKAIVVRASDVKPEIILATFTCEACGFQNYQQVVGKQFTPLITCTSRRCKQNKTTGKLVFNTSGSKFVAYQELKIQETSDQLIEGNIPRTFLVQVSGDLIKQASPGDVVEIQGVLLPNRRTGIRHRSDIIFDGYIECYKIIREKKKYLEFSLTSKQIDEIDKLRHQQSDGDLFTKLANSIAPEIFGMESVKKALLLLMVGGVSKNTHDNVRIRGQINVALIGDPGIAKSQLLKQVMHLSPRGIYTTGKGSSGVGLTAAVIKDPITGQMSLEAGALVLADKGVCCIDEFDKMDEHDRTAIHEVMEQQTVSIAKAGIVTTLNARTSILAAANPLYGRYNKKQTPHKNINLPAALLSRFDLIFILLDKADTTKDMEMAMHIGYVHQKKQAPKLNTYRSEILRSYIALAKGYDPVINEDLHHKLTKRYINKRKQQTDISKQGYIYTTPRTLLGLIRLCQARARIRFSTEVSQEDVEECLELIEESQSSIMVDDSGRKPKQDSVSSIFQIIKNTLNYRDTRTEEESELEKKVLARGFKLEDFKKTIQSYERAGIIMLVGNSSYKLVDSE